MNAFSSDQPADRPRETADSGLVLGPLGILGLSLFFALWLVYRRAEGAIPEPTAARHLLIAACSAAWLVGLHSWLAVLLEGRAPRRSGSPSDRVHADSLIPLAHCLSATTALLLGLTLSWPAQPLATSAAWVLLLAAEMGSWFVALWLRGHSNLPTALATRANSSEPDRALATDAAVDPIGASLEEEEGSAADEEAEDPETLPPLPADCDQQIRRGQSEAGEYLVAQLKCSFEAEERMVPMHLAFCPPFPSPPELECQVVGPEELSWKVTECETFGARFEVRRGGKGSHLPAAGELQVFAFCQP